MNRWRISKDWGLVWGLTFLIIGLIFYIGYRSSITEISSVGSQGIVNEPDYPVTLNSPQNIAGSVLNKMNANEPQGQKNSFDQEPELKKEIGLVFGEIEADSKPLELRDFPSPIAGKPIRNVGNYYYKDIGSYSFHAGVDYALLEGTVIRATHGGKVIVAGQDVFLGQKVTLDCGEGWLVTYGGLENLRIKNGDIIKTQDALGQVGLFSGADGENGQNRLHYEVWHDGQVQRPVGGL